MVSQSTGNSARSKTQTTRGLGLQAHSTALTLTEEQSKVTQLNNGTPPGLTPDPQSVKKSVGLSLHIVGLREGGSEE